MITKINLVNIYHLYRLKVKEIEKKILVMRTLRIYSLNFHM